MRKTIISVIAALIIGTGVTVAWAADEAKPERKLVVGGPPTMPVGGVANTTVPEGKAPEFPGKHNRNRVPQPTGQQMTHTTGTIVRFN